MNKMFFTVLLLSVLGFVGYKYYYNHNSSSYQSHDSSCCQSHSHESTKIHDNIISLRTVGDLDALLAQPRYAFVKVYLDGCPPCKQAAAIYPEIAEQFPQVAFYDLNVSNSDVMNALIEKNVIESPITAAPTFIVIKNGKTIELLQGFNSKEGLIDRITPLFNN